MVQEQPSESCMMPCVMNMQAKRNLHKSIAVIVSHAA